MFYQGYDMSTTEYAKNFKALIGVVETNGGGYGCKPGLFRAQLIKQGVSASDLDAPDLTKSKKAEEICCKQYFLCMLLQGADQSRYSKLKEDLSNDMTKGANNFPKIMVTKLQLMSNYKVPVRAQRIKENSEDVAFVQEGKEINAKDIKCWHCCKKGHC
jgi:hypothetical protein